MMRAQFEKVEYRDDSSWRLLIRELDTIPFGWHFHPEYELTLTLNSAGERYIGDNISKYGHGDLTLVGPNIPHTWQSQWHLDPTLPQKVYVLWFDQAWVDNLLRSFPEFAPLDALFQQARHGVAFPTSFALSLLPMFEQLDNASPARRSTLLLSVLASLTECDTPQTLGVEGGMRLAETHGRDQRVLSQLLERIHAHYTEPLFLPELAQDVAMSESTLIRFFKRLMGQSVNRYITQVRIGKACSLLIRTDFPVSLVAEQAGFTNQANFNRLFLKYKQMTPRQFRQRFKQLNLIKRDR
ncbi:helix-turn-helix domain-containing protein [Vibrio furnissii]|uniref:helix-turn-helix domain-containing protein n=1 Tax=Vibrio furnissii TaxID=29494 RepID=UPI001E52D30C|nr:AraC family transcriptional regulator [Vibrio furnissii]UHJ62852.1 AraC family transcriptional regulator [Vibrio furnissii]